MATNTSYSVLIEERDEVILLLLHFQISKNGRKNIFLNRLRKFKNSSKRSLRTLRLVLPYFWPKGIDGTFSLRMRVVFGVLAVIAGRAVNSDFSI